MAAPRGDPFLDSVRAAFESACFAELAALKPGNVHVYAGGHGMGVEDFRISATAAAAAMARRRLSVGERIASAVAATFDAVGCNTNLGIVLLAAPLVHAALAMDEDAAAMDLRTQLSRVLAELTLADAEFAFAAIRRANPAGLGRSPRHDVNAPARGTLLAAMRAAAKRDRIAAQYASGFADVFAFGVPRLREVRARLAGHARAEEWAASGVYLAYLSRFPDSHVVRKHGKAAAARLRAEAAARDRAFAAAADPESLRPALLAFDTALKAGGINPGTSADLTVGTLLADRLLDIVATKPLA